MLPVFAAVVTRPPLAFASPAVGVGNNPESITDVRRANGGSGYARPFEVIPARGQITGDSIESSNKERCDVFHDDESGSKVANESRIFSPQSAPLAGQTGPATGDADVLAGEAADDDVDVPEVFRSRFRDVTDAPVCVRIVPIEHPTARLVDFNLPAPLDIEASDFRCDLEAADAREEREADHPSLLACLLHRPVTSAHVVDDSFSLTRATWTVLLPNAFHAVDPPTKIPTRGPINGRTSSTFIPS